MPWVELLPVPRQISVLWTEHLWTSVALSYRYLVLLLWPMELIFFRYYEPNRRLLEPAVLAGWLSLMGSKNAEVHARIGEIHLARGEARQARRRFWRALQLHPQNSRALAGMAALRAREAQP